MNVFLVERNDKYIRLLLHFLERFHQEYVLTNTEPPEDIFFDSEDYQRLLDLTLEIADSPAPAEIKDVTRSYDWTVMFFDSPEEVERAKEVFEQPTSAVRPP